MFGLNRCGPIRSYLWEYAEGTLEDAAAQSRVERHLTTCDACRALVEDYRDAAVALRDFATSGQAAEPARPARWEDVQARLVAPSPARASRRPLLVPAFGIAGAALALSGAVVGIRAFTGLPGRVSYEAAAPTTSVEEITQERAAALGAVSERGPVRLSADPSFLFLPPRGTYPITVRIRNIGPAVEKARLTVRATGYSDRARTYYYDIDLTENAVTKLTVYPSVPMWGSSGDAIDLTLTGPFPRRSALVPITSRGTFRPDRRVFGYIGDGLGVLQSRVRVQGKPQDTEMTAYGYAKPEDAPEKAIGYDSIDTLVLGQGAERMSHTQWAAIRQWVLSGGSLVMTAGVAPTLVSSSDAAEIAPVDIATRGWTAYRPDNVSSRSVVAGLAMPIPPTPIESALAKPDAEVLGGFDPGRRGTVVRRRLGAGTALYVGVPPAEDTFRDRVDVYTFWNGVAALAAPTVSASQLRQASAEALWFRSGRGSAATGGNPFQVTMPRVSTVVNIFALYFVLAVPVTFVMLKRLRRMEWAWATGPALAVLTAGGVSLMSASLYTASLSRRTAGVVVGSASGEARFIGFTELFFPRAGTFSVTIPGVEEYEYHLLDAGDYYGSRDSGSLRLLDTYQMGSELTTSLPVGNLSFRRLYHTQSLRLNGGVTGSLRYLPDGTVRYAVRNDTGKALENGFLVVPNREYLRLRKLEPRMEQYPGGYRNLDYFQVVPLPRLEAGSIHGSENAALLSPSDKIPDDFGTYRRVIPTLQQVGAPVVVAQMSGEEFGPRLGRAVGDDRSVIALFTLPPGGTPAATAQKGGRP